MADNKTNNEGVKRTTMTLSLTVADKRLLKQAALDRDTTVSALVHEWAQREFGKGE